MTTSGAITAAQVFAGFTRPRKRSASPEEQQALLSATRHEIDHEGRTLVVWSWGGGKPVLLLHGWESRASHMAAFVPALLQAGYQPIAFDGPAHGESEGEVSDVLDFGRAAVKVAAHFAPLSAVIAHSMGSAAALYAFAHGVRVHSSVHLAGPSSLSRVLHFTAAGAGLSAADTAAFEAMMTKHLAQPLSVMDLSELSFGMQHPALILHDPEDREMPFSESQVLNHVWPESVLEKVAGVGHRRILREPEVVRAAVSFIARSAGDNTQ